MAGQRIYEIEYNGRIYEVQADEGAPEEDLFSAIEGYNPVEQESRVATPEAPVSAPTAQAPVTAAPLNAITNASNEVVVPTKAWAEVPGAQEYAEGLFWQGKQYGEAARLFTEKFPGVQFSPEQLDPRTGKMISGPDLWAAHLARAQTPEGLADYQRNGVFAPVNLPTGVADEAVPEGVLGEFGRGIERGIYQMANTVRGFGAVGADVVGADETAREWADDYTEQAAATDLNLPSGAGTIQDVDGVGSFAKWAAARLGEFAPQIASSLGAGYLGKAAAEKVARKYVDDLVEQQVAQGVAREAAEASVKDFVTKQGFRGATAGAFVPSYVQSTGGVYGDTYGKTGELSPWTALGTGAAVAALDTFLPARIFSKVGGKAGQEALVQSAIKKYGKEGATDMLLEGSTEGLQSIIEQLPSGEVDWDAVVESFAAGALAGGVTGVGSASYQGRLDAKDTPNTPRTAPVLGGTTVVAPTATNRRTKAYKAELAQARQQVEARVGELKQEWENPPTIRVEENFSKMDKGVDRRAIGVTLPDGSIVLNTENILATAAKRGVSPDVIVNAVTFHEGLGHFGLLQSFGEQLDDKLSTILANSPVHQRRVNEWMRKNKDAYAGDPNRDLRAFEEILAEASEAGRVEKGVVDQVKNKIKDFGRRMGLTLEYSTREVDTILAMAHSAVINGKGRDVASNGFNTVPKYMQAGQRAKTANRMNLLTAKKLLKAGSNKGKVRKQTGWHQGNDGKWRFELDDSKASFKRFDEDLLDELVVDTDYENYSRDFYPFNTNDEVIDALSARTLRERLGVESMYLKEVYDHPELFAAYPELENVQVVRESAVHNYPDEAGDNAGGWDEGTQTIFISPDLDKRETMETLVHEIQHAVQDIEGFARGGNRESAVKAMSDSSIYETAANTIDYVNSIADQRMNEGNLSAEKQWRDVSASIQQAIDDKDISGLRTALTNFGPTSREAYHYLGGEMEARDTENRLNMSAEERQATAPYTSENLDPRYLINDMGQGSNTALSEWSPQEFIGKLGLPVRDTYSSGESKPVVDDRFIREDQILRRKALNNRYEQDRLAAIDRGIDPSEIGLPKYMMMSDPDKVEMSPEEIAAMSPEDIVEATNAYDLLERMTEGYKPTVMSYEDLEREAELRGLSVAKIMNQKSFAPGDITRRMFMYDIAMTKLDERISELYSKMNNGTATYTDRSNYLKTTFKQQELAARIWDEQSEVARALNAMKRIQYTRRRVQGVMETVAQFKKGSPEEYLNDPDAFFRFATDIQNQIDERNEKLKKTGQVWVGQALNLPRSLMSSMDLSAPLRQGIFLIHKKSWWTSFGRMFNYAFSQSSFDDMMESITARPTYGLMQKGKLALSNLGDDMQAREEAFMSNWAEKIPGFGRIVRGSERAYVGFLNRLRADVFDQLVADLPEGYTDQDLKDIAGFVNSASGRGNLAKGLQGAQPMLNALLFSPRLMSSRLDMTTRLLRPSTYMTLNKTARKEYIKSVLAVGSMALMITSLAVAAGAEGEEDPRSSDFGKIKVGNTRYDILGGEGQYIVLAARLASNSYKTTDGQVRPYGNKYGQTTRLDATEKFIENKAAPIPSFVLDYLRGVDATGKKFDLQDAVLSRFVPMITGDVQETINERGAGLGLAMSAPSVFGVGVQTYTSQSLDTERELEAPDYFKMKDAVDGEYGTVSVKDGQVTLGEEAKKEWNLRLNSYYKQYMEEEVSSPEWKTYDEKTKREVIQEVRDDARKDAKADMMDLFQIEVE